VEQQYWYQLYLDDLPIWGMVGAVSSSRKRRRRREEDDE